METPQKIIDRQTQQKADFIERYKKTPIVQVVCEKVGIGRSTFYRWIKEDHAFYQQYLDAESEGREFMGDAMESRLIQEANNGSLGAIIFFLKHNHPRYSESFGSLMPQDIKEIATYIQNAKDQQDDYSFLAKLFKRRVPVKVGRYILQILRKLTESKMVETERKKVDLLLKIRGKR